MVRKTAMQEAYERALTNKGRLHVEHPDAVKAMHSMAPKACGRTKLFGRVNSAEGQTIVECDLNDNHEGEHSGLFFPDYRVEW